jgi:ABC-type sugar transport system permease subunit
MFTYLFGSAGYLNEILHRLGAIDTPIDWLAGDWRSLGVILVADLWKVTPLVTLILLARLESVPESALEAAAVDGAGAWRRFWYITLPLLRPALITAVVLRATDALRILSSP